MSKQQFTRRFQLLEYMPDTETKMFVPEVPTFFDGVTAALAARVVCAHLNTPFSGLRLREMNGEAMPDKWRLIFDDGTGVAAVEERQVAPNEPVPPPETEEELMARTASNAERAFAKLAPKKKKGKRA